MKKNVHEQAIMEATWKINQGLGMLSRAEEMIKDGNKSITEHQLALDVGKTFLIVTFNSTLWCDYSYNDFDFFRFYETAKRFSSGKAMLWNVLEKDGHILCNHLDGEKEEFWINSWPLYVGCHGIRTYWTSQKSSSSLSSDTVARFQEIKSSITNQSNQQDDDNLAMILAHSYLLFPP